MMGHGPDVRHEPQVMVAVDGLVTDAIHQNLRQKGLSLELYSQRVVEHYRETVPASQQSSKFVASADPFNDMRSNAKKLGRMLNLGGDLRIPAVLLPSLIAALDEPWRSDVATATCQRIAPSAFKRSAATSFDPLDAFSQLVKEQGEALQAFLNVARNGLADDAAEALLDARTQLIQAKKAEADALALIDAELDRRGILRMG
jgi:hypothetical protein